MMKNFSRSILLLVCLTVGLCASAQFRWGPMVGAEFSNLKFKQDLVAVDQAYGFDAGVVTETMFPGIGFGLDTGIFYSLKGAKVNLGEKYVWASEGYGDSRVYMHYITVPLHLRFKWTRMGGFEEYLAPFVYGGPAVGFLAGHSSIGAFDWAAADFALEVGFGVEIKKQFHITAVRNWGMTYALKTKVLDDFSARNRSWSIRFTYFLK